MRAVLIVVLCCVASACSHHAKAVRCDDHLIAINPPAHETQAERGASSPAPSAEQKP